MDWPALRLSVSLGLSTVVLLLPAATWLAHWLMRAGRRVRGPIEALVALPLVLPPTVVGFYLLTAFGARSPLGEACVRATGQTRVFRFEGLVCASVLV
ncbi:MAG: molybdate ABC transporter permease subunit, partial [Vicinamibacteria bacterium]